MEENNNESAVVEMIITPTRTLRTTNLGKVLRIGSKAVVDIDAPGSKIEYKTNSIQLVIGIGNDYTAMLSMSEEAFLALNRGEKIHITTVQERILKISNGSKRKK